MLKRNKTAVNNNLSSSVYYRRPLNLWFKLISCFWLLSGAYIQASVSEAVGQLTLTNPETGLISNCSATLVAPNRVATVASCLLSEERSRQAQSASVCFTVSGKKSCYSSREILTHSNYLLSDTVNDANNLAYIILNKPVTGVEPLRELSPKAFERLLAEGLGNAKTMLVGYNPKAISQRRDTKDASFVQTGLEYDYIHRRIILETAELVIGDHYEGTAVVVEQGDANYLLGMISSTNPDDIVRYYPELNPCDEDPITVWYVDKKKAKSKTEFPIMLSKTHITAYPVAACGMNGFQSARGYSELSCVRMMRKTDLETALEKQDPVAMRQQAILLSQSDDTTDHVIDIYKLLDASIKTGDPMASVTMARLLLEGEVFPRDSKTAEKLLREQSLPEADWLLASELLKAYSEHDMRSINAELDQTLMEHVKKAAEAGIAEAQYFYGRLFQFGIGVKENIYNAYVWYAHAAMQGEPRAQFQVGTMWVDGRSKRAYPHVGYYWIRQAAARGYIRAQNYLALNQRNIDDALDELKFEYSDT